MIGVVISQIARWRLSIFKKNLEFELGDEKNNIIMK